MVLTPEVPYSRTRPLVPLRDCYTEGEAVRHCRPPLMMRMMTRTYPDALMQVVHLLHPP